MPPMIFNVQIRFALCRQGACPPYDFFKAWKGTKFTDKFKQFKILFTFSVCLFSVGVYVNIYGSVNM